DTAPHCPRPAIHRSVSGIHEVIQGHEIRSHAMEAGGDELAKQGQRRLAVRSIAEIAQDLVERAVLLHHVDDVFDFPVQEIHYFLIPSAGLEEVSIVVGYPGGQIPERVAVRNSSAHQGGMFQLELILVLCPLYCGLSRIAAREGTSRGNDVLDEREVAKPVSRVRTGYALAVGDVHPAAIGTEGNVRGVICRREEADRGQSMRPTERYHSDRVRTGIDGIKRAPVDGNRGWRSTGGVRGKPEPGGAARVDLVGNGI